MSDDDPVFYVGLKASWISVLAAMAATKHWGAIPLFEDEEFNKEMELAEGRVRAYRILESPSWQNSAKREREEMLNNLEIEL